MLAAAGVLADAGFVAVAPVAAPGFVGVVGVVAFAGVVDFGGDFTGFFFSFASAVGAVSSSAPATSVPSIRPPALAATAMTTHLTARGRDERAGVGKEEITGRNEAQTTAAAAACQRKRQQLYIVHAPHLDASDSRSFKFKPRAET